MWFQKYPINLTQYVKEMAAKPWCFSSRSSPQSLPPHRRGRTRGMAWRGWPWGGTSLRKSPWGWRCCAGWRWLVAAEMSPLAGLTPGSWPHWWLTDPRHCQLTHPENTCKSHSQQTASAQGELIFTVFSSSFLSSLLRNKKKVKSEILYVLYLYLCWKGPQTLGRTEEWDRPFY